MVTPGEPHRRLVVAGVMASMFLAAMESTVVATAMPTVIASLGGLRIYSWTFSGFLLASTVTMPLWGRLADQYGRRRVYLVGLSLFLVGSALSGLSQTMAQLIAFRAIQGLGAGSLIIIGMTIIADLYGLERRAKMQGYFSGVWGVASLVGPVIGGVLTDAVSWRWVFYINLPFGLLAMAAIRWGLASERSARRASAFDYAGTAVFAAVISALLVGLLEGGRGASWWRPSVLAVLGLSAVLLVVFVLIERRAAEPVVPLALFANPMVRAASVTGFLSGMAMFGAITFVPADFGVDEVGALMVGAGYQTQVPSLLLCEGVAIYLERGVLESLLRHLRQIACSGSRLAISLSVTSSSAAQSVRRKAFRAAVAAMGEPARTVLSSEDVDALLATTGWQVVPSTNSADTRARRARLAGLLLLQPS